MKIAVIGTSHTGALHAAWPEISQKYPELDAQFFGLPGIEFTRATYANGILTSGQNARALPWMAQKEIDLNEFDQILLTGPRFGLGRAATLIARHELLELRSHRGYPFMSMAAMEALLTGLVELQVDELLERFGRDERFCYLPAPYPLARSLKEGPGHEELIKDVVSQPQAEVCIAKFETAIAQVLNRNGVKALFQPKITRDAICTTKDHYARSPEVDPTAPDHRHMNAAYGRASFSAYATDILGLKPQPPQVVFKDRAKQAQTPAQTSTKTPEQTQSLTTDKSTHR